MDKINKSLNLKAVVSFGLPFILILIVSYLFQTSFLGNKDLLIPWLESFGPLLVLVYIIFQTLTIIIAPIGGLVFMLAIIGIFGPETGFVLSYMVTTPVFCVNFLLAKKYGRQFVSRILGDKVIEKIDHYSKDAGIGTIIMLRVFMSGYFDYLSYVLGLTKMPFKIFIAINFIAGIPAAFLGYFTFTRFENFVVSVFALQLFGIISAAMAISISHWQERLRNKL